MCHEFCSTSMKPSIGRSEDAKDCLFVCRLPKAMGPSSAQWGNFKKRTEGKQAKWKQARSKKKSNLVGAFVSYWGYRDKGSYLWGIERAGFVAPWVSKFLAAK